MGAYYSTSIIKKLFSLCGNICAFESCDSPIIDEFGSIMGEICHIEGEKPKSARYNSKMTEKERNSFKNLLILCPTHHTMVDKNIDYYTVDYLKNMKYRHERKYRNDKYNISPNVLEILKVSINTDQYSLERVHNYLNLSKQLKNSQTLDLWYQKFGYIFKWLKISSPIKKHERLMLNEIFEIILQIKPNKNKFEDLLLNFLDKIPVNEQENYVKRVKAYFENIVNSDFHNENLRRLYKYLNRTNEETLKYLIDNAGSFKEKEFNDFMSDNLDLKQVAENKQSFLFYENKIWKKLDLAKKRKSNNQQLKNLEELINRFISINL